MEEKEFNELSEILFGLAGNFGDTIDEYTVKMWIRGFEADSISLDQIKKAALKILQERDFPKMPTYGEFRKYIFGQPKDNAQAQVDIVLETLHRHGSRIRPNFTDPITQHLMTTRWKWERWAADVLEDEIKWWRKEFIEAYQSYAANPQNVEHVQRLTAPERLQKLVSGIGSENREQQDTALIED